MSQMDIRKLFLVTIDLKKLNNFSKNAQSTIRLHCFLLLYKVFP